MGHDLGPSRLSADAHGVSYRAEIDGLRAVAILSVMLFHLRVPGFAGGYVGVDIFFVISGFLITRNIVADLRAHVFTFVGFYLRRIRRLFPALLFMVAAVFIIGALWLPPDQFRALARDTVTSLVSISNISFWRDSHAYFATDIRHIPLLHTWSLGVEEQFYLLWPAMLVAICWFRRQWLMPLTLILLAIATLAICQIWLSRDAAAAFYLMPFRTFEFCVGGLCVWLENQQLKTWLTEVLFLTGLLLVAVAVSMYSAQTRFPGISALVPTAGAALTIVFGASAKSAVLLRNRVAVSIGLISYSLYLCHWPIITFAEYIFGGSEALTFKFAIVLVSITTAALMYRFIETPFRWRRTAISLPSFVSATAICIGLAATVGIPALVVVRQNGSPWRLSEAQRTRAQAVGLGYSPCTMDARSDCAFGDITGPVGLQILGDSYAEHYVAAVHPALAEKGLRGEAYTLGGWLMLPGLQRVRGTQGVDESCRTARDHALVAISRSTTPLLISQAWLNYGPGAIADDQGHLVEVRSDEDIAHVMRSALEAIIEHFGGLNRKFLIVGAQVIQRCKIDSYRLAPGPLPHAKQKQCPPLPAVDALRASRPISLMLEQFRVGRPNVTILFPQQFLCDRYSCPSQKNGVSLYWDEAHLTVAGAELAARAAPLQQFLKQL